MYNVYSNAIRIHFKENIKNCLKYISVIIRYKVIEYYRLIYKTGKKMFFKPNLIFMLTLIIIPFNVLSDVRVLNVFILNIF